MSPPVLRCESLSLSYDGLRAAVCDVSFSVEQGSIFALVGPNGAGKTSTLRMLATLATPTSGRVVVDGVDAREAPDELRRRVGYLPDHFALYEPLTPVEYLEFFARCHGVPARERAGRIDALLEELDLTAKRGQPIRTLSRGMRQRLGLAKTLVHEPKVLILDEPASALDPSARAQLRGVLERLRRRGLAIVISSHILPDLAQVADAVGIMEGGRMLHAGPVDRIAQTMGPARAVYRFELRQNADRAERVLATLGPRVVGYEIAAPLATGFGRRLDVEIDGGPDAVAEVVEQLVLRGVRVAEVAPRESTLEALYRASAASKVA